MKWGSKVTCYDLWDDTPAFPNTQQQLLLKARPVLTQFLKAMWEWNMLLCATQKSHKNRTCFCAVSPWKNIFQSHFEGFVWPGSQSQEDYRDRKRTPPENGMWQILGRTGPWEQLCLEDLYFRPCCCSGWPNWRGGIENCLVCVKPQQSQVRHFQIFDMLIPKGLP